MSSSEPTVETTTNLRGILHDISFAASCVNLEWEWEQKKVYAYNEDGQYEMIGWHVRTFFTRPDTMTGVVGRGSGRWEFIERGSTESGAVKTCWLLFELMIRHECMEAFLYKGDRIFDPHNPVDLLAMATKMRFNMVAKEGE